MDKCKKCGYESDKSSEVLGHRCYYEIPCLKRQLAAANERAGRLEAQMVELREAWPDIVLATMLDETDEEKAASVTFHRILGGA